MFINGGMSYIKEDFESRSFLLVSRQSSIDETLDYFRRFNIILLLQYIGINIKIIMHY